MSKSKNIFEQYTVEYDNWYDKNVIIYQCELEVVDALQLNGLGLDVGVGSARLSPKNRNFVQPLIGLDLSKSMLLIAKKRGIEPVLADAHMLPFKNNSFDYIFVSVTFCFLENPEIMIKESYRILKPSGKIGICIVPKDSSWGKFYENKGKQGHKFYKHAKFYTVEEVIKMLNINHFEVLEFLATLSYGPNDNPRLEKPTNNYKNMGFVCIKAARTEYSD
ncbi:MAG: class I SAM-dependent methyltransferase [Thermoprotei archaeon]|jgi:ubiquinone/menaquinone biosynthesis C-methylase UbiE